MKLIRPGPSIIGWILSLSTKINSGNDKLKHSPRLSCKQVRRNHLIKSTVIVRNTPVNEVGLTEIISREEASRFMWRKKKIDKKSAHFLLKVKLDNYFYFYKIKYVIFVFMKMVLVLNNKRIDQLLCGDNTSQFAFIFFPFGVGLTNRNEMRKLVGRKDAERARLYDVDNF